MVNVFEKLKVVFCNVLQSNGGNDLVEEYRGKEEKKIRIEKILKDMDDNIETHNDIDLHDHEGFVDDNDDA